MTAARDPGVHGWLARRMKTLSRADLSRAMQRAGLGRADWLAMTGDCAGCSNAGDCGRFLTLHDRRGIRAAPDTRPDPGRFRLLKTALEEMGH
ncbi:DUF6455 family protein [Shimia sp.]|uniref:DUF6455 family protein n=1 Tax=Shimia sp. TaxID=1954381 RepID=UPI00356AA37E